MPSLLIDAAIAEKQRLRAHARTLRRALSSEYREKASCDIAEQVVNLPYFLDADVILGFYPLGEEPNVLPILKAALSLGKKLALPRCHKETSTMTFHLISSLEDTELGSFGLREPSADTPTVSDFSHALCLVPALCFDRRGHRIGYGKGYYDRFLADYDGLCLGIVYEELLVDVLPCEPTDKRISMIITERGILTPDDTLEQFQKAPRAQSR